MSLSGSKSAKQMAFAERLRLVRHDLYGDAGGRQALADALDIRVETWTNYELGVVMPAEVVLKLQVLTSVSPSWLLNGTGDKYHQATRTSQFRIERN